MEIEVIVKTEKGNKSTEKEIDSTVDEVMKIALKLKGDVIGGRCYCDGTSIILKK
ncbi:MAG: hypothetical protein ISS01_00395 [Nanoarchaeota archaeon]|nr:hypothetical protein [Nanoarchaeota archaeon]